MTKGEGLVAFLYAIKDLINTFAIMFITGVAVISFFWLIVSFVSNKAGVKLPFAGKLIPIQFSMRFLFYL